MPVIQMPDTDSGATNPPPGSHAVRPPTVAIIAQALLLVLAVAGFFVSGLPADSLVAAVSVYGSVFLFGVVRMLDDSRRTKQAYSDWTFVSARSLALWLMMATWAIGLAHIYRAAIEATRDFSL